MALNRGACSRPAAGGRCLPPRPLVVCSGFILRDWMNKSGIDCVPVCPSGILVDERAYFTVIRALVRIC